MEYDVGDGDGDARNDPTWVPENKKACSSEVHNISKNHHKKTTKKTSTMRRTSYTPFTKKSTEHERERSILGPNIKNIIRKCLRKSPASSTLDPR